MATAYIDPVRRDATSASNAQADLLCPGRHMKQLSVAATTVLDGDAEQPAKSSNAQWGDRIHAALKAESPAGLTLDEQDVYDGCVSIRDVKIMEFFGKDWEEAVKNAIREERFWTRIQPVGAPDGVFFEHSGAVDYMCRTSEDVLIIDYKTLTGDVAESPQNMQLRDLACLVHGQIRNTGRIGVVIVQPLVTRDPVICVYTPEDIARAEREMFGRVAACNSPAAPRKAGEVQCKHCTAKGHCEEYARWAGGLVPAAVDPSLPTRSLYEIARSDWTPEQWGRAAEALNPAMKYLEEFRTAIKQRLAKDPSSVPGWGLRMGNTVQRIVDPDKCFQRFLEAGGKVEQFLPAVTVGKTKLRESLSFVTGLRGKKLEDAMQALLDGITESKTCEPTLVREKR